MSTTAIRNAVGACRTAEDFAAACEDLAAHIRSTHRGQPFEVGLMMDAAHALFPGSSVEEDLDGQVLLYTGLRERADGQYARFDGDAE